MSYSFSTDLTFVTNEPGRHLSDRFASLLGEDKAKGAEADTSKLEQEIGELVYALYGLTAKKSKSVAWPFTAAKS